MYNLGQFEERLNRDAAFRRQFFEDPVTVLRKEGLMLSPAQESSLKDAVAKMKLGGGGIDALSRRTLGFTWFLK